MCCMLREGNKCLYMVLSNTNRTSKHYNMQSCPFLFMVCYFITIDGSLTVICLPGCLAGSRTLMAPKNSGRVMDTPGRNKSGPGQGFRHLSPLQPDGGPNSSWLGAPMARPATPGAPCRDPGVNFFVYGSWLGNILSRWRNF